jgi:uncharacterized protein YjgD (DUF1641 family)
VSWRLENSIRLRSQNRCAAFENLNDSKDITGLGKILKRISNPQIKRMIGLSELNVEVLAYFN